MFKASIVVEYGQTYNCVIALFIKKELVVQFVEVCRAGC